MEQTTTPEGLVRRTITKPDGRFLEFYNTPGEEQPINPDAEEAEPPAADSSTAQPSIESKDNTAHV